MLRFENRAIPIVLAAVTVDVIGFGIFMPVLSELITELGQMDLAAATRVSPLAWPAMNGLLSRMVVAIRQGALQGGLGSMNSVAAIFGPLIAAQSLAWGTRNGFDGAAFLVAGVLIGMPALIIAFGTPRRLPDAPSTQES